MLINQIGVEPEPPVVELRPRRPGEAPLESRVTLTDLLGAVWSVDLPGEPEPDGSRVTTLELPGRDVSSARESPRADVA